MDRIKKCFSSQIDLCLISLLWIIFESWKDVVCTKTSKIRFTLTHQTFLWKEILILYPHYITHVRKTTNHEGCEYVLVLKSLFNTWDLYCRKLFKQAKIMNKIVCLLMLQISKLDLSWPRKHSFRKKSSNSSIFPHSIFSKIDLNFPFSNQY